METYSVEVEMDAYQTVKHDYIYVCNLPFFYSYAARSLFDHLL